MTDSMSISNSSSRPDATAEQLGAFLKTHHEIEVLLPTIVGMLATSRFKARGATALLINLVAVTMTREILEYLKKPLQLNYCKECVQENIKDSSPENGSIEAASIQEFTTESSTTYYVVHSIPGRIRLQIPRLVIEQDYAQRLENLLTQEEQVISVRVNRTVGSLAINYQAQDISNWDLGIRLMNIMNLADAEESFLQQGVSPE